MKQEQADSILGVLDGHWCHGTPASEYPNSRCLGLAISDTVEGPAVAQVVSDLETQIRRQFPARARASQPLLPMWSCCGSKTIPSFNNHPDTSLDDIRQVVLDAVH